LFHNVPVEETSLAGSPARIPAESSAHACLGCMVRGLPPGLYADLVQKVLAQDITRLK
jgi:hypothetical protein